MALCFNARMMLPSYFSNKTFRCEALILIGYYDCIFRNCKFLCKRVYFWHCDKNFVYYNLNKNNFPLTKEVYLASHPCDAGILKAFDKIYLWEQFEHYRERMYKHKEKAIIVSIETIEKRLKEEKKGPPSLLYLSFLSLEEDDIDYLEEHKESLSFIKELL